MKELTLLIYMILPISLFGQLHIEGPTTSNETIIKAESNYSGSARFTAISGEAVSGTGSKEGVRGRALGDGTLYGVYGYVTGGFNSEDVFGVYGYADNGTKDKYGVYGRAIHNSGTKYGIYGTAGGTGTTYAGYFDGDVTVTGNFDNPSDMRLKRNITPLEQNVLNKVLNLNPVSFEFKTDEYSFIKLPEGTHTGFIAQEIELLFPELVNVEKHPDSNNEAFTFKGVNYLEIIPLLTKAIQAQQVIIEDQKKEIEHLKVLVEMNQNTIQTYMSELDN